MTTKKQLQAIVEELGLIDLGDVMNYLDGEKTSEAGQSAEEIKETEKSLCGFSVSDPKNTNV